MLSSITEFHNTNVVEDAHVEETNPNVARASAQANITVCDRYDIGRAVWITKWGEQPTDNERETYLSERWVAKRKDEYPYSEKKQPTTQVRSEKSLTTRRYLGKTHRKSFPSLPVSREPE